LNHIIHSVSKAISGGKALSLLCRSLWRHCRVLFGVPLTPPIDGKKNQHNRYAYESCAAPPPARIRKVSPRWTPHILGPRWQAWRPPVAHRRPRTSFSQIEAPVQPSRGSPCPPVRSAEYPEGSMIRVLFQKCRTNVNPPYAPFPFEPRIASKLKWTARVATRRREETHL